MPNASCDHWWESETEWHRKWKSRFPAEWQEVVQIDPTTGEKHIADVKTETGLVIEFQHSRITPDELQSRERFYENMIWVVDGDTGTTDVQYFYMGLGSEPASFRPLAYYIEWWGPGRLLHNWAEAVADVYFDFGNNTLWCLRSFNPEKKEGVVTPLCDEWLVEACLSGDPIPLADVPEGAEDKFRRKLVEVNPYWLRTVVTVSWYSGI